MAIDCDGTLIYNDIGEAMMRYMITRRKLSADRAFWNHVVPERMGRDALQAAYKAVAVEVIRRSMTQRHTDDTEPACSGSISSS